VIVTRAQPNGIAAERELLQMLVANRGTCAGVCLDPHTTGELAFGNRVGV
jgi:hypothetical protein